MRFSRFLGEYKFATITKLSSWDNSTSFVVQGSVIEKNITNGPSIEKWAYQYLDGSGPVPVPGDDYTLVQEENSGRAIQYVFYGTLHNYGDNYGDCYKYGLMRYKATIHGNLIKETSYTWDKLTNPLRAWDEGQYAVKNVCSQDGIYIPALASEATTIKESPSSSGVTYTTSYQIYDDYSNPLSILETGNMTRATTKSYWQDVTNHLVKGFPSSVTITGVDVTDTFTSNYQYYTDPSEFYRFGKLRMATRNGITTEYDYNTYGNLDWLQDAVGNKKEYDWSNGSISEIRYLNNSNVQLYNISRAINWDGTVASETNGRGYTTNYEYDNSMRLTLVDPPEGNSTIISYLYDAGGYLYGKREARGAFWQDSYIDGLGRVSGTEDRAGVSTAISYGPGGTKIRQESDIGDTVEYDALGRLSTITHQGDNSSITYTYVGNDHILIEDEFDNPTHHYFRSFGDPWEHYLYRVVNPLGEWSEYQYNILGSLTEINRGDVVIRQFHYDSSNLMDSETHPETGTTTYDHYSNGNLKEKTENGIKITYTYDGANRLTSAISDAASGSYFQEFSYDGSDNIIQMKSKDVQIDQTFDQINRLKTKISTILGKAGVITYTYDDNDNIKEIDYPSGLKVQYDYNELNQATRVYGFGGSISPINYFTTSPRIGLLRNYTRSNGQIVSYTWDERRRMLTGGSSGLPLGYQYDTRGNMTDLYRAGKDQSFEYDDLNRVTEASGPWDTAFGVASYSYDSVDNRETKSLGGTTTGYGYTSNLISSETGRAYAYNGGKVSRIGDIFLSYDPFNNMITSNDGYTDIGNYNYDAQNNRVCKMVWMGDTYYYYNSPTGQVLSEIDGNGNTLFNYIYLNNILVAKTTGSTTTPAPPGNFTLTPLIYLLLNNN